MSAAGKARDDSTVEAFLPRRQLYLCSGSGCALNEADRTRHGETAPRKPLAPTVRQFYDFVVAQASAAVRRYAFHEFRMPIDIGELVGRLPRRNLVIFKT